MLLDVTRGHSGRCPVSACQAFGHVEQVRVHECGHTHDAQSGRGAPGVGPAEGVRGGVCARGEGGAGQPDPRRSTASAQGVAAPTGPRSAPPPLDAAVGKETVTDGDIGGAGTVAVAEGAGRCASGSGVSSAKCAPAPRAALAQLRACFSAQAPHWAELSCDTKHLLLAAYHPAQEHLQQRFCDMQLPTAEKLRPTISYECKPMTSPRNAVDLR